MWPLKISFIQFFGIGSGVAIVVDATIVRGVLVPAVMRLVGERIWWAPRVRQAEILTGLGVVDADPAARKRNRRPSPAREAVRVPPRNGFSHRQGRSHR
jgi:RND superfamily putative drug exporter